MNILTSLKGMLADGEDANCLSSKRVITFMATLLVMVAFVANMFWGFKVEEYMYNAMMVIVLGGLSTTVAEKFAPRSKDDNVQ
jgi:FtsH-binding integral membrane protein